MSSSPTKVSEYGAITNIIQRYIDGAKTGRGDDMKPAFHEDATVFGYVGADLFAGPSQKLFDWNDENGPATFWHIARPSAMGSRHAEAQGRDCVFYVTLDARGDG